MDQDQKCSSFPLEVVWEAVDSTHLLRHPQVLSVQLTPVQKTFLPAHLQEDGVREFRVTIEFENGTCLSDIDEYVKKVGYYVFDSNTEKHAWGTVFKRDKMRGYWRLHSPCIYCYGDLIDNEASEEQLKRAVILSYI